MGFVFLRFVAANDVRATGASVRAIWVRASLTRGPISEIYSMGVPARVLRRGEASGLGRLMKRGGRTHTTCLEYADRRRLNAVRPTGHF